MAATTAGAIKAYLEGRGYGIPWYRDGAPVAAGRAADPPYGTVQEGIAYAPERHGDTGDLDAHQGEDERVQVDLWQPARARATAGKASNAESYTLPGRVRRDLHGAVLPPLADGRRIYGLRVVSGQRWPISENVVRHTYTVAVRRDA